MPRATRSAVPSPAPSLPSAALGDALPAGAAQPSPAAVTATATTLSDLEQLRARRLLLPVSGIDAAQLRDTFAEGRAGHVHEAIDILAPRGTPVLAVDDGHVEKLFNSARGGLTV